MLSENVGLEIYHRAGAFGARRAPGAGRRLRARHFAAWCAGAPAANRTLLGGVQYAVFVAIQFIESTAHCFRHLVLTQLAVFVTIQRPQFRDARAFCGARTFSSRRARCANLRAFRGVVRCPLDRTRAAFSLRARPFLGLILKQGGRFVHSEIAAFLGAVFREEEDAAGYFLGLWDIVSHKGCPAAIYTDLHTIFRSPKKQSLAQELKGEVARSQYGRLLSELGIELVHAHTPQAKGRIERLFGTLQDRLVKALREAGASSLEEANQVLAAYLPQYNQRFMVKPAQPGNVYCPFPQEADRKDYFCFKHQRKVANDNTISFDGKRLQILPNRYRQSYAKAEVEVRQHLDGSLEICYQEHSLVTFQPAENVPLRVGKFTPKPQDVAAHKPEVVSKPKISVPKKPHKPAVNHPWRRYGRKVVES